MVSWDPTVTEGTNVAVVKVKVRTLAGRAQLEWGQSRGYGRWGVNGGIERVGSGAVACGVVDVFSVLSRLRLKRDGRIVCG